MFDIAFSELVVIGVVALVILGPERLPKVARTAGHLFGRLQRYVATVKADLNREMEMSELSKVKQEVQEAARAFEQSAHEHAQSVEAEARSVSTSLESSAPVAQIDDTPGTQSQMLADQEHGLVTPVSVPVMADVPEAPQKVRHAPHTVQQPPTQSMLDLGVEPVRAARP